LAELSDIIAAVVREERGRILGGLMRLSGSLDLAEEAFQDATLAALLEWKGSGVPNNPGAWLMTVAKNRARDMRRHHKVAEAKASMLLENEIGTLETIDTVSDDYLRLVFTCCHPAISVDNQIALTLKVVAGFSSDEIARAFVCSEATISQRILRAKQTIEDKRLSYSRIDLSGLPERMTAALGVIYAMFNEGHTSRSGALMRVDLQAEALRLGRLLGDLAPREPEVFGLIAMMAFGAARARTRVDEDGFPILLSLQDRSRWDGALLREGLMALQRGRSRSGRGAHMLQAEIAACHVTAPTWEATDWTTILGLYDQLLATTRSAVVALNRAIAISMLRGPLDGLAELKVLETSLAQYHLFYATRADFLERTDRDPREDLGRAIALATNDGERRLLERRLAMLS
jgi:RNA polymerase sigma factor (sigma-70 family)